MRIQTIEITNYKAFLGRHKLSVSGKNLFIYGENGSGKSSFYYALKDFFQSSIEGIDLNELENTFVPAGKEGKAAIKVNGVPAGFRDGGVPGSVRRVPGRPYDYKNLIDY